MNQKPAYLATLSNNALTVVSLLLTIYCFTHTIGMNTTRMILFVAWMAFMAFSLLKIFADLMGGEHRRRRNYQGMMDKMQESMGSRSTALAAFCGITLLAAVFRLGVPLLIWLL